MTRSAGLGTESVGGELALSGEGMFRSHFVRVQSPDLSPGCSSMCAPACTVRTYACFWALSHLWMRSLTRSTTAHTPSVVSYLSSSRNASTRLCRLFPLLSPTW